MLKVLFVVAGLLTIFSVNADYYKVPKANDLSKERLSSVECIAVNLYHESRSESDLANIAVIASVLNRVKDKRYPNDVCKVVFQKHQYSWTSDGLSDSIHNDKQYKRLYKLTEKFIINKKVLLELSKGIDHYHTVNIKPYWSASDKLKYVTTVDNHKFYKWVK